MAGDKASPDWGRIELDYRAGIKSLRQIASEHGFKSDNSIRKRAAKFGWQRDLNQVIHDKADEIVRRDKLRNEVRTQITAEQTARTTTDTRHDFDNSEEDTINANAQAIADIKLAHRKDIGRARELCNVLLSEIEELSHRDTRLALMQALDVFLDTGELNQAEIMAIKRTANLNTRIANTKTLTDSLKTVVLLERQAFGMDKPQEQAQDPLKALLYEIAQSNGSAFMPVRDDPEYVSEEDA